jgi:hypothetical protein
MREYASASAAGIQRYSQHTQGCPEQKAEDSTNPAWGDLAELEEKTYDKLEAAAAAAQNFIPQLTAHHALACSCLAAYTMLPERELRQMPQQHLAQVLRLHEQQATSQLARCCMPVLSQIAAEEGAVALGVSAEHVEKFLALEKCCSAATRSAVLELMHDLKWLLNFSPSEVGKNYLKLCYKLLTAGRESRLQRRIAAVREKLVELQQKEEGKAAAATVAKQEVTPAAAAAAVAATAALDRRRRPATAAAALQRNRTAATVTSSPWDKVFAANPLGSSNSSNNTPWDKVFAAPPLGSSSSSSPRGNVFAAPPLGSSSSSNSPRGKVFAAPPLGSSSSNIPWDKIFAAPPLGSSSSSSNSPWGKVLAAHQLGGSNSSNSSSNTAAAFGCEASCGVGVPAVKATMPDATAVAVADQMAATEAAAAAAAAAVGVKQTTAHSSKSTSSSNGLDSAAGSTSSAMEPEAPAGDAPTPPAAAAACQQSTRTTELCATQSLVKWRPCSPARLLGCQHCSSSRQTAAAAAAVRSCRTTARPRTQPCVLGRAMASSQSCV